MALQVQIAARNKIEAELTKPVTNLELPAVGVIAERAYPCGIRHLRGLTEVVVGVGAGGRAIVIACPQQQTASLFIGMDFDFATGIRFRQHAVVGIVGLGELCTRQRMEYPRGRVFICTLARDGGDGFIAGTEGAQRHLF